MPGTPLDLEYPETGDTVKEAIDKLSDSIEAIEIDLEAKVVPGELDMTSQLDMQGNDIVNVGAVELDDVGSTTGAAVGSIVYANGEFNLVTSAGAISLTSGGEIDISSAGGWTGFTTGVSAAHDNGVFSVYEGASDYGNLSSESTLLQNGNTGTTYVKLKADSSVAGSTEYALADRSNVADAMLNVSASGVVTTVTTIPSTMSSTLPLKHGSVVYTLPPLFHETTGTLTQGAASVLTDASSAIMRFNLPYGARLTACSIMATGTGGNAGSWRLYKYDTEGVPTAISDSTAYTTLVIIGEHALTNVTSTTQGSNSFGIAWINSNNSSTATVASVLVTYDIP